MATRIQLPYNNWKQRPHQDAVWQYLKSGGRHAELIWHRRAGKDEIALHHAACCMFETPGNYWHMLPLATQIKKAIWQAVNSHTGIRRIKEAFPEQLFSYNESDMIIKCRHNDSTWQCVGSDNYEGTIGSSTKGIVYSEWALANPSVRGYLRPIITENNGWQIFITTPRGKNHAYNTYRSAQKNPLAFAEKLTIHDTGALTPAQLKEELLEYVATYGEDQGLALYEQEYECSFEAAILGAIWGKEFHRLEEEGRICNVPHDPNWPVHVAMDIGRKDATTMWWFQVMGNEIRILEYYANNFKDPDHYCSMILGCRVNIDIINDECVVAYGEDNEFAYRQAYRYGSINMPHDAQAKTFATKKSAQEQFAAVFGWGPVKIVPNISRTDGINATRKVLGRAVIDISCEEGIEACKQYQYEWDDKMKRFKDIPLHDWASDPADGLRYLSVAWSQDTIPNEEMPPKWAQDRTFMEMVKVVGKRKRA